MRTDKEALEVALRTLGAEPTDELMEQFGTLVEALQIYEDRSQSYGQVWRQYGALSNLLSVARKADRLMECWWHNPDGAKALTKDALDDAFDMINYATFFIRNEREGNLTGSAPERPDDAIIRQHGDNTVVRMLKGGRELPPSEGRQDRP